MKHVAILLCGGSGQRMEGAAPDKVLARINGREAFLYSMDAFAGSGLVDTFLFIYRDEAQRAALEKSLHDNQYGHLTVAWEKGGQRRQDSVYNALHHLKDKSADYVLIHDCARPMLNVNQVKTLIGNVEKYAAAVLAHRVTDSIKQVDGSADVATRLTNVDRTLLWAMETPQAFRFDVICRAYEEVLLRNLEISDDTAACEIVGHPVKIIENKSLNLKITYPSDLSVIGFLLKDSD